MAAVPPPPAGLVNRALGGIVLICCWSSKGGVGTTVVATALALTLARDHPAGVLVCDLGGDVPAVLGVADPPSGIGLAPLLADGGPPAALLAGHEVEVGRGVALLPRGEGPLDPAAGDAVATQLALDPRPVVVDAGVLPPRWAWSSATDEVALALARGADRSLLVVRPCFLALRRALAVDVRPSGTVVVVEEGRALGAADVEQALGAPVLAQVRVTPQVSRAVDAGILAARMPRTLERDVRDAVGARAA